MACLIPLAPPQAFWYSDFLPPRNLDMKRYIINKVEKYFIKQTKP